LAGSARAGAPASRCGDILKNVIMWDSSFTPRMNGSGCAKLIPGNCSSVQLLGYLVGLLTSKSVIGIWGYP